MPTKCPKCGASIGPDEMVWPGDAHEEICQNCWEQECSESWWRMVMGQPVTSASMEGK